MLPEEEKLEYGRYEVKMSGQEWNWQFSVYDDDVLRPWQGRGPYRGYLPMRRQDD